MQTALDIFHSTMLWQFFSPRASSAYTKSNCIIRSCFIEKLIRKQIAFLKPDRIMSAIRILPSHLMDA